MTIAHGLECPVEPFPITYLGLSLSIRRIHSSHLLPHVDRIRKKLSTWRASLLARDERLARVRHVLYAMPGHLLAAIILNVHIIKLVNWVIRDFLWHGRKDSALGERLARHDLPHSPACALCDQALESIQHLLIGCLFSCTVWHDVFSKLRLTATTPIGHESFFDSLQEATMSAPPSLCNGTASLDIIMAWTLWKHKNACIFDNTTPSTAEVSKAVLVEARFWAMAGANGLRIFIFEPP
ncbi:Soluble starch synthase 3, chloroplastic/amyloplastic [Hordeum vulgare]|nr:Soluble starch synthase 3, chloroplastic/amyloplastic [Hordeum vulgare]